MEPFKKLPNKDSVRQVIRQFDLKKLLTACKLM